MLSYKLHIILLCSIKWDEEKIMSVEFQEIKREQQRYNPNIHFWQIWKCLSEPLSMVVKLPATEKHILCQNVVNHILPHKVRQLLESFIMKDHSVFEIAEIFCFNYISVCPLILLFFLSDHIQTFTQYNLFCTDCLMTVVKKC
jgi:hypothetical protein